MTRPFFSDKPAFLQYEKVSHISNPGLVGVVTAITARGDFYTYEVTWDVTKSGWYEADTLVVFTKSSLGFTPTTAPDEDLETTFAPVRILDLPASHADAESADTGA